jgi:predicted Zn-dependent protease
MRKNFLFIVAVLFLFSCSRVMITGRKQVSLVSDADLLNMSFVSYKEFIDSVPLSTDLRQTALVKQVGKNIAGAVESYMKNNGLTEEIANYAWEFNLVQDEAVNAFCMPGGKVVFFEGILPVCEDETGIAVVMGHEVAHAVAKHSKERMSQQMLLSYGSAITDVLLTQKSDATRGSIQLLYGLGAQYGVILPYSRNHESEADRLGLIFMAMAGYDPGAAIAFWERMAAGESASVPEFLSTHPASTKRVANIKKYLPEALAFYKQ